MRGFWFPFAILVLGCLSFASPKDQSIEQENNDVRKESEDDKKECLGSSPIVSDCEECQITSQWKNEVTTYDTHGELSFRVKTMLTFKKDNEFDIYEQWRYYISDVGVTHYNDLYAESGECNPLDSTKWIYRITYNHTARFNYQEGCYLFTCSTNPSVCDHKFEPQEPLCGYLEEDKIVNDESCFYHFFAYSFYSTKTEFSEDCNTLSFFPGGKPDKMFTYSRVNSVGRLVVWKKDLLFFFLGLIYFIFTQNVL